MHHYKRNNRQKRGKNFGKQLLSLVLCVVLAAGVQPVPHTARAAAADTPARAAAAHVHCVCGGDVQTGGHTHTTSIKYDPFPSSFTGGSLPAGNYYLTKNVECTSAIEINNNTNLCLNGYTLSSDLPDTTGTSSVLMVNSDTSICDCSEEMRGKIQCMGNQIRAIAIRNSSVNFYGGTICGGNNKSDDCGGGVWIRPSTGWTSLPGKFYMYGGSIINNLGGAYGGGGIGANLGDEEKWLAIYGGSITNNSTVTTSDGGGGVYFANDVNPLLLSGNPVISGNKKGGEDNNIYLDNNSMIQITGPMTNSTPIGISISPDRANKVFTSSTNTDYNDPDKFTSDKSGYAVVKNADGQLELKEGVTVSFDGNGSTVSQTEKTVCKGYAYGDLPVPEREGYTFTGWFTSASGGTKVESTTEVTKTANHTLYAHWEGNVYSVTYEKDNGTITNESNYTSYTYGTGLTLPKPAKTGYTFGGWFTESGFTGTAVSEISGTDMGDKTYYAKWTPDTYTITFSGAVSGDGSSTYDYKQTGTIEFPQAVDKSDSGKFFTGWKLTTAPAANPTVNSTAVNTSTLYQPGQALAFTGGAMGNMTFTAQYDTVTGTPSTSETLTVQGRSSISAPPAKITYTVKVTGNDSLKALTIGGVTVTRSGTENFVLTTTGSGSKQVVIDGENAGSVAANGTLTLTYKTLTVTVNADRAVTLQGGPALTRSGPVNGVYTYTHTARNPANSSLSVLVDGADTGKKASYGSKTVLTYYTATARITAQSGAQTGSVELVSGSKTLVMNASGSNSYTCRGLNDGTSYTLRVNGVNVSGQTTNFAADKTLNATIYSKTVTTKVNDTVADVPGVGEVKIGGLGAERTGTGTYLATQVGASIGSSVSVNGTSVTATGGVVNYYTVAYDADGGVDAPADTNIYPKGEKAAVLGQGGMTKDGCSFLGWKNGGTNADTGDTVTVNSKVTLTARWQEDASCAVKWQTPGGEVWYGTLEEALDAAETTPDLTITVQDGKTATISKNHTLPEGTKLVIPEGARVVSDADDVVLTLEGKIENAGEINAPTGTLHITESGSLTNTGTVIMNIVPNAGKIDNTGGTLGGEVENTDGGSVEGGTITGTVTGGTVTGPLINEGTIQDATVTGPVDLPEDGELINPVVKGTVTDKGGNLSYTGEHDGTGTVTTPGGGGTGSDPVQKLIDALGGAAVESPTGTVKLVADVDLITNPLIIDSDVVIDLNGHTITGPEGKPAIQIEGGDVTIRDSSDPDSDSTGGFIIGGTGIEENPAAPGIENTGDGTLTIEGGSISGGGGTTTGEGEGRDGGAGIKNSGDGDVVVNGGEVTGGDGGSGEPGGNGGSGIENTGSGTVSVEDGKVEGGRGSDGGNGGSGVTNTGTGTVDISGGEVTGGTGGTTGEGDGGNGGSGVTNTGDGTVDISGGKVTGGSGGTTGEGDGGVGGRGVDGDPDKVTVAPDIAVNAGEGGTGGDGTVTLRDAEPAIDTIPEQVYTGTEITPAVVVRDGADIIPVGEYIVEYRDNINEGTATVIVKDKPGKENALYKLAETTTTFVIKKKPGTDPTPAPGGTTQPGQTTPEPGETAQPTQPGQTTPEPGETSQPGQTTPEPGETAQPGQTTPEPGGTAQPGQTTPVPGETAQPGTATQTPGGMTQPGTTTLMPGGTIPTPVPNESGQTGNQIEKRKDLSVFLAVGKQKGRNSIRLTWSAYKDVSGYEVYWSYCDGKKNYKKLETVEASGKHTFVHKKLKKDRACKYYIAAYKMTDGIKQYTAKSPTIHVAMKYEKHTNVRKLTVNKAKVTLRLKKKFKIKAKTVLWNKKKKGLKHVAALRYFTDNKKVATVSKKGKITAKAKGSCTVYVIANNGVAKKIKVKVK